MTWIILGTHASLQGVSLGHMSNNIRYRSIHLSDIICGRNYDRCLLTSFVISNILTDFLVPNTSSNLESGLILRLFLAS